MFIYKHTETIEYVKKAAYFLQKIQTSRVITREFLGLTMRNFQGIVFIWSRAYSEIFKSALVYL